MSHDDEPRGPGVPTVAWVTLGLLAFSWLAVSGVAGWELVRSKPTVSTVVLNGVGWAFVACPIKLFAVASWRAGDRRNIVNSCLTFAIFNTAIVMAVGSQMATHEKWLGVALAACAVWPVNWLVGPLALAATFRDESDPDNC